MEELQRHITLTLNEAGCIKFDVMPDADVSNRLRICERFVDQTAFEAHQARTKASNWSKVTDGIERHYEIMIGGN